MKTKKPAMPSIQSFFNPAMLSKVIHAKGIDPDKLPTKEELDQLTLEKAENAVRIQHQRHYYRMSVWSGSSPLHFKFSDWDVTMQKNEARARKLGNQAFRLTKELATSPFNVVMSGDRGTGKTSLALAIMDQLMNVGQTAMFVSTAELLRLVNEKYEAPDIRERLTYIAKDMKAVDLLILDDFGTESGQPTENGYYRPVHRDLQAMMYQVANARTNFDSNEVRHATIITTNNRKKDLEAMYDRKTIDRLMTKNPAHQLAFDEMEGVRNV
ncbi:ATP-binding protein [Lactiplantibacillus plantarum]|uniref:ATP-binding protein n=1 Tax=Lactiplantibacillus plantarum TaxID=1590 RepID=UPI0007BC55F5|nr:ATP-binding protein [Lactiplantibacillus plantarum]KZU55213.1 DNA replication protein [Lactiplantibacillus plantarum]